MRNYYLFIAGLGVFIAFLVIVTFMEVGSPLSARSIALDEERVQDFYYISYSVDDYYSDNNKLPTLLTELKIDDVNNKRITDPNTNKPYDYGKTSESTYELCATFSTNSKEVKSRSKQGASDYEYDDYYSEDKEHKKGYDCIKYDVDGAASARYDYVSPPTPIAANTKSVADGNIKQLSFNYKWRPIPSDADIILTNVYLTTAKVEGGDSDAQKSSLLVEYSVMNTGQAGYFYGGELGDLSINGKLLGISSESGKDLEVNETGKVYGLFLVDPSFTSFNLAIEEVDQSQTIVLDFSKATVLKGQLDLDTGFSSAN